MPPVLKGKGALYAVQQRNLEKVRQKLFVKFPDAISITVSAVEDARPALFQVIVKLPNARTLMKTAGELRQLLGIKRTVELRGDNDRS
jgi:hypothetical protein